jgi:hypothetical protein
MSFASPIPIHPAPASNPPQSAFVLRLNEDTLVALRQYVINGGRDGIELELGEADSVSCLGCLIRLGRMARASFTAWKR